MKAIAKLCVQGAAGGLVDKSVEYGTRKGVCRWMRGWLGGVEEEKRIQYVVDQVRNGEVENETVNGRRWWRFGSCRRVTRLHLYFIRAAPPALTQLRQAKFSINPVNGSRLTTLRPLWGERASLFRICFVTLLTTTTTTTSRRQICPVLLGQEYHHHLICSVAAVLNG